MYEPRVQKYRKRRALGSKAYFDGDGDLDVLALGHPEALEHSAERAAPDLAAAAQLTLAHERQLRHVRPRVRVLVQRLQNLQRRERCTESTCHFQVKVDSSQTRTCTDERKYILLGD